MISPSAERRADFLAGVNSSWPPRPALERLRSINWKTVRVRRDGPRLISSMRAFEAAGVEFIDENGGGAGVRLRKPSKKHQD